MILTEINARLAPLPVELDAVPPELKIIEQWIHWKVAAADTPKVSQHLPPNSPWLWIKKEPTQVGSNYRCSAPDPKNWSSFEAATAKTPVLRLGFVVTPESGVVLVDLDDCRDPLTGILDVWAQDVISKVDSYTEVSPSGSGLRLFCFGKLAFTNGKQGTNRGSAELYAGGHYGTVTGLHVPGTSAAVRHCDLADLQSRVEAGEFDFTGKSASPTIISTSTGTSTPVARRDNYSLLKAGEWAGLYASASDADLALANFLARDFRTYEAVDREFRQSGMMRQKWDEIHNADGTTYGTMTIHKALAGLTPEAPAPIPESDLSQYCTTLVEIAQRPSQPVDWIIGKYVACGAITALFSKIKLGKSSLALSAVHALLEGTPFLGCPTIQGHVVMLTEMSGSVLRAAFDRAGLKSQTGFTIMEPQHFYRLPTWEQRVDILGKLCKRDSARLLIVDTLGWAAGLSGEDENSSGAMMRVMLPLQRLCSDSGNGFGILCLVHERKSGGDIADSMRGSSATGGAVDILMNLAKPAGNHRSETIRRINAVGRFPDTPAELVIDWTDQGEYVVLGDSDHVTDRCAALISNLLPVTASEAKTIPLLREESGESRTSIQRVLRKLVRDEEAVRLGSGDKGDPFRYHRTKWKM